MKNLLLLTFLICAVASYAQVGIGTTDPDDSALLEINSTEKGVLLPRLTTAERNAIADPADGLVIFNKNSNSKCTQVYRHVDNGNAWYDICCSNAVENLSNFSAAGVLFSPDKFFAGANGTGGAVANGGDVGSIGPVDLSAFGAQYPSAGYFNKFEGPSDAASISVTQTLLPSNVNDYTASAFLTKNGDFSTYTSQANTTDDLRLDLNAITTTNAYQGDFTLTVVARYNVVPSGQFRGFFAVGATNTSNMTFQLDNTTGNKYSVSIRNNGNTLLSGDASTSEQAVPTDDKFHLFNVIYQADVNGSPLITFYIDGMLQAETKSRDVRIIEMVRLLNNRLGNQSVNGSMAYFGLDNSAKTQAEISNLSKGIACLFDEL